MKPLTAADAAAQEERARVLRHPEIAARLCQPPLSYSTPEHWNGWIAPDEWNGKGNDSPRRAALYAIIRAAIEADKAEQETTG